MKKVRLTTIMVMAFISLSAMSCKDAKTENSTNSEMITEEDHSKMNHDNSDGHHDVDKKEMAMNGDGNDSQTILNDYFNLKDALVADDNAKAKELGATLATSLGKLDISKYTDAQQSELKDIMEDAIEHAEHISESDIKHQREHFKVLSKDVTDMVAITGTQVKLYEQFCPMYDGGTAWLSTKEEIRNPYYGSQMLKCGKVQREIN